jgi:hypothetical protein
VTVSLLYAMNKSDKNNKNIAPVDLIYRQVISLDLTGFLKYIIFILIPVSDCPGDVILC